MDIEDIDPFMRTHLIDAFAGLDEENGQVKSLDTYNDFYDNNDDDSPYQYHHYSSTSPSLQAPIIVLIA